MFSLNKLVLFTRKSINYIHPKKINASRCKNLKKKIDDYIEITYLKAQNIYQKMLWSFHNYKRRKSGGGPFVVVFLVSIPESIDSIFSIYKNMKDDMRFKVHLIFACRKNGIFSKENKDIDNYNKLKHLSTKFTEAYDSKTGRWLNLNTLNPDIIFVQNPYDSMLDKKYCINNLIQFAKVCYVPYALFLTSSKWEEHFYGDEFHKKCWKIFHPSREHMLLHEKYLGNKETAVVSGYPKLDQYNAEIKNSDVHWNFNQITKQQKRLIWTPHWTVDDVIGSSNFIKYYKYFLNLAKQNTNVDLLIRPHPLLFANLLKHKHLSEKLLSDFFASVNTLPNMKVNDSVRYFDIFRTSDMLICDNSSFLGEYLPTKNPIIYTHSYDNDHHNLNEFGKKLTKDYYIAKNEKELDSLIKTVLLGGDDFNKSKRLSVIENHLPQVNAAKFIKEYIFRELN